VVILGLILIVLCTLFLWDPHINASGNNDLLQTPIALPCAGDGLNKFLPYQLTLVVYGTTMAFTGNGEQGFGSGEGA